MIDYRLVKMLAAITGEEQSASEAMHTDSVSDALPENHIKRKCHYLAPGELIKLYPHKRFADTDTVQHSHDFIELVYMVKGTTYHRINETEIVLREGELLLIGNGASHSIRRCSEGENIVNFIIHPDFFEKLYFTDTDVPIVKFLADSLIRHDSANYFHFQVEGDLMIQNTVESLINILLNGARHKQTMTRVMMEVLFHCLSAQTEALLNNKDNEKMVMQAMRYIDKNYANGSLAEIARQINCSPSWLSREIKKVTGNNFKDLIQDKRLSQAVFLLKNTNMKITDIAASVGYENTTFFHRIFSEKYGITPAKLRELEQ